MNSESESESESETESKSFAASFTNDQSSVSTWKKSEVRAVFTAKNM